MRARDLVVGVVGLVVVAPLLVGLMALVALTTGEAPLFVQARVGKDGRIFRMAKLRTMRTHRGPDGVSLPDHARVTALGRWLRRLSLDELPELWHVVTGEMSLVGPRPLLPEYLPRYSPRQARRHAVRPGITGWAQVNGRNRVDWPARLEMDVWYVEHRSLALDARILASTVAQVLRRDGITPAGQEDVAPFLGEGGERT